MKEQCKQFALKMVEASLDDHYLKKQQERAKIVFDEVTKLNDHEKSEQINDFVSNLQRQVSGAVYQRDKVQTLAIIEKELSTVVDELLSEEEATELYAFISTPTGQKVFRNLDLVADCVLKGRSLLAATIINTWDDPEIAETIENYIRSIE